MKSPFEDLQIEPALVCEFFAAFTRFEYAMKASRFCRGDRWNNAIPDWGSLKQEMGGQLEGLPDEDIKSALIYLVREPPMIQKLIDGHAVFRHEPLSGPSPGAQALEAVKRVRNNLFHGGKHTPHSPPERDKKLICAALTVLYRCLKINEQLSAEYEHQLA